MSESATEWLRDGRNSDGESKKLLALATPDIYQQNAFRVFGLPVEASAHDVNRQSTRLLMARRAGIQSDRQPVGVMPLSAPADENQIAIGTQRLTDPESRLIDELFWFWPMKGNSSKDEALNLLGINRNDSARLLWMDDEQRSSASRISTHNLAVYYHVTALDIEQSGNLSPNLKEIRDRAWTESFARWRIIVESEDFWSLVAARIKEIDDPRLTTALAEQIRHTLPKALLLISARLALRAAERSDQQEVDRHIGLMQNCDSIPSRIQEALQDVASSIRDRIHQSCKSAADRASKVPSSADKEALGLLGENLPLLRTMDCLLRRGNVLRDAAFDEVVVCALRCQVIFGKETEDWNQSIKVLESILPLAASATAHAQVKENLEIVRTNSEGAAWQKRVFGKLKPIPRAPGLGRVFGIGFRLYGHKDFDKETRSYLTNYYFVVLGIPIFPIRRYRVIRESNGFRFLGKQPLRALDKWHLGVSIAVISFIILLLFIPPGDSSSNSTNYGTTNEANRSATSNAATAATSPSGGPQTDASQALLAQIDSAKASVRDMEVVLKETNSELQILSSQIDEYKKTINTYESASDSEQQVSREDYEQAIAAHNSLVEQYNAKLASYRARYSAYSAEIDHINSMVASYNAGSR